MRRVIPGFLSGTYIVTRSLGGEYIKGRFVAGNTETIKMVGSLQPIGGRELKHLEEGERIKDHYTFYSDERLSIVDASDLSQADVIQIDDDSYRVVSVEEWSNEIGFVGIDLPHFKTILKREPQQNEY